MQGSFKLLLFLVLSGVGLSVHAQIGFPVNGTADEREGLIAFTNATIHTNYKTTLNKATLLVRKGKIEAAGTSVTIPPDAVVRNLDGMHIYPSFIEPFSGIGMPENKPDGGRREHGGNQIFESTKKGAYYQNQAIKPETDAAALFANNPAAMEELRKLGFGFALTHVPDGIARGTAAFVSLSEQRESKNLLTSEAASVFSFDKGSSPQDYPGSLMGAIALLRQAFADAEWYAKGGNEKQRDLSLEALNRQKKLPALFEVSNKYSALRAAKIGKEFGYTFIVKGAGDEYQRIQELKDAGLSFIIPLTFPAAYEVEDPLKC